MYLLLLVVILLRLSRMTPVVVFGSLVYLGFSFLNCERIYPFSEPQPKHHQFLNALVGHYTLTYDC